MGDFQCSVFATLCREDQAILNISTSAQLAFVMKEGFEPTTFRNDSDETDLKVGHVEYFPYFQGKYLAVAAALTGGNALAAFVRMLQQWAVELGANVPQCEKISQIIV
jgi:sedoheptulokinase